MHNRYPNVNKEEWLAFSLIILCQKPGMDRTTVWLYLLYICHTMIHRKLQNVVYIKKKSMLKKNKINKKKNKKKGEQHLEKRGGHHKVLSTRTCDFAPYRSPRLGNPRVFSTLFTLSAYGTVVSNCFWDTYLIAHVRISVGTSIFSKKSRRK